MNHEIVSFFSLEFFLLGMFFLGLPSLVLPWISMKWGRRMGWYTIVAGVVLFPLSFGLNFLTPQFDPTSTSQVLSALVWPLLYACLLIGSGIFAVRFKRSK